MVLRVQQVGEELHIVLSSEAIATLNASAGTAVEVTHVGSSVNRVATLAEGIAAYEATESLHRQTYAELAK